MSRFTNNDIKLILSDLRSKIRNGVITVGYRTQGASALKDLVLGAFQTLMLDASNFNPQTVRRFEKLFDVPVSQMGAAFINNLDPRYPTQDETATAIQNFINRRDDPWAHVRPSTETLIEAASVKV